MIVSKGIIYDSKLQNQILDEIENNINMTRSSKKLDLEKVINLISKLGESLENGEFQNDISELELDGIQENIKKIIVMLKRENIEYKLKMELGIDYLKNFQTSPPFKQEKLNVVISPLGTLLHIAAGNVDALPVYSLLEGLLTGNVNILKLPQADNGLSIKIIMKMIEIEPEIADFIYVFDTPSSDLYAIKRMAEISDGIIVWGGDEAISAVRKFAPIGCRIIEWGHKLGFVYISGYENKEKELEELAEHIISTKQLLCSSCQTIYINTDDIKELYEFCDVFLPIMEKIALKYPLKSIDSIAENSLRNYNNILEDIISDKFTNVGDKYIGENCSLTICQDSTLELSNMFGNCLVKKLPLSELFSTLRKTKGYLQTAGLICESDDREMISEILINAGLVRIMRVRDMSSVFSGESHDGTYALRHYVRVVNIQ